MLSVDSISIVCLYNPMGKSVAEELAKRLQMFYFNAEDLFLFDHQPRSLQELLKNYGEKYYRKKEKEIIKYASSFTNTVMCFESGSVEKVRNCKAMKYQTIFVYLHLPLETVYAKTHQQTYATAEEKRLYAIARKKMERRMQNCKRFAEITVNISNMSAMRACSEVLRKLSQYQTVHNGQKK